MSELPASCDAAGADTSPPAVLNAFVGAFDAHYVFFAERRVPWDSLTAAARARVSADMTEGGQDLMGRTVAARFAPGPTVGLYKYAGDADDSTPQPLSLPPSERSRFTGDVYVLTTDLTGSAGESFVLYMRGLPNVTHVGEPTLATKPAHQNSVRIIPMKNNVTRTASAVPPP